MIQIGSDKIVKVMQGNQVIFETDEWKQYPGTDGTLFYRFKSNAVLQLYGFAKNTGQHVDARDETDGTYVGVGQVVVEPFPGYEFDSWAINGAKSILANNISQGHVTRGEIAITRLGILNNASSLTGTYMSTDSASATQLENSMVFPVDVNVTKL